MSALLNKEAFSAALCLKEFTRCSTWLQASSLQDCPEHCQEPGLLSGYRVPGGILSFSPTLSGQVPLTRTLEDPCTEELEKLLLQTGILALARSWQAYSCKQAETLTWEPPWET